MDYDRDMILEDAESMTQEEKDEIAKELEESRKKYDKTNNSH